MMMAYRQEHQGRKVSFSFSSHVVQTFSCTLIYGFCFLLFSALCVSTNHVRRLPLANFLFVGSSMLVSQTSPLGVELFSYANAFFFPYKFVEVFFCRVRYCVTFIVAVGTLLFVIKLIR